jgi:hypothetical protein
VKKKQQYLHSLSQDLGFPAQRTLEILQRRGEYIRFSKLPARQSIPKLDLGKVIMYQLQCYN